MFTWPFQVSQKSCFCSTNFIFFNLGKHVVNSSSFKAPKQTVLSQDIRLNMVKDLLEEEYYIYPLEVAPRDLGLQGVARNRVYIFCAHKTKCRYLFSVYEAYYGNLPVPQKVHPHWTWWLLGRGSIANPVWRPPCFCVQAHSIWTRNLFLLSNISIFNRFVLCY